MLHADVLKRENYKFTSQKERSLNIPRSLNLEPEKVATFIYKIMKQNLEGSHKILSITTFCHSALTYVKEQQNTYYPIT